MNKNDVKVVKNDKKLSIEDKLTIKELEEKLVKMNDDKEAKCRAAKDQLINMIEITADKYRTATGVAEALRVLRFVCGEEFDNVKLAKAMATEMASVSSAMAKKAKSLANVEMDQLCKDFYDEDFVNMNCSDEYFSLALEMMKIDLCRNVGGAAEDMVSFVNRADEEIEATKKALVELQEQ